MQNLFGCSYFTICLCSLSHVRLCGPWTVAHQTLLSMEFSKQEHWSGSPFPSPGDLPNPGIKPGSPALQVDSLLSEPPGKPNYSKFTECLYHEEVLHFVKWLFWPLLLSTFLGWRPLSFIFKASNVTTLWPFFRSYICLWLFTSSSLFYYWEGVEKREPSYTVGGNAN